MERVLVSYKKQIIFCKRTHYALILMVTLAQHYGVKDIAMQEVAHLHHLPVSSFQVVTKRLVDSGLIATKGADKLSLKIAPEKITIWQIVACVSNEMVLECNKCSSKKSRTSTVIMISKEDEVLQSIISSRLNRYKLSGWSKKASETVYL